MAIQIATRMLCLGILAAVPALATVAQQAPSNDAGQAAASTQPPAPSLPPLAPPKAPKVTCHSDQLTISADNSTLGSILAAVHNCIGVQVDLPNGAADTRVFEELGPGPARQILESLLNGTEFNYVIGSSDADPQKIDSVLLLLRGADAPGSSAGAAADHALTPARRAWMGSRQNRMAGAPPGAEANQAAEEPPDPPAAEDAANAPANSPAEASKAPASQPPATDAPPAAPAAEAPAPSTDSAAVAPSTAAPSPDTGSNPGQSQSTEGKITDMQQLFQQRRQMNQTQNQNSTSPQP
jgi:hypothetical protein